MQLLPVEKHSVKINNTIIKTVFPGHNFHAENWIKEIKSIGDKMQRNTNLKCAMTGFTDLLHNSLFDSLKTFALEVAEMHEMHRPDELHAEVDELWGAVYKQNDYADNHAHYPSAFSFVYYLKSDPYSAPLKFADSENNFSIPALPGTFTLFPGYLFHYVPQHNKQTERIIIAGNIITRKKR